MRRHREHELRSTWWRALRGDDAPSPPLPRVRPPAAPPAARPSLLVGSVLSCERAAAGLARMGVGAAWGHRTPFLSEVSSRCAAAREEAQEGSG